MVITLGHFYITHIFRDTLNLLKIVPLNFDPFLNCPGDIRPISCLMFPLQEPLKEIARGLPQPPELLQEVKEKEGEEVEEQMVRVRERKEGSN